MRNSRKNLGLWLVVGFTALVVNPNFACSAGSDNQSEFNYDEADMQQAVLGTWQGTLVMNGKQESFTLTLEQSTTAPTGQSASPTPGYKMQCGTRTFIKSASACASMSQMPLVGTITSDGGTFQNAGLTGDFNAYVTLSTADLQLLITTTNVSVNEQYLDGVFQPGSIAGGSPGSFTISSRISR